VRDLIRAAAELQSFMLKREWRFCFIGGIALQRWGRPRVTIDADLALLTGLGDEEQFIEPLVNEYEPRHPEAVQFALQSRVLLIQSADGIPFDISLAAFPFEREVICRATDYVFYGELSLRTCSAEDLVVLKAFADRPRDWVDIEGILTRQGAAVNRQQILDKLQPLCELKEAPEIAERLRRVYERLPAE